ncbi:MAG: VacJ family lipoprotein [Alphaproteobacteria bacterium]
MNPLSKVSPRTVIAAAALLVVAACATPGDEPGQIADPLEPINRYIFAANLAVDTTVIEPVATFYRDFVPDPARDSVRNFLRNLESPVTLANDVLQRDLDAAGVTTKRFFINTTIGVLGLFDPATDMGLARRDEDFGQTLGTYGVGPGVYLVLPILGPSSLRDVAGNVVDYYFDPLNYYADNTDRGHITVLRAGIRGVDARARTIETLDEIERTSIDFYATIRSLYHQRRQSDIRNGSAPSLPKLDLTGDTEDDRTASLEN